MSENRLPQEAMNVKMNEIEAQRRAQRVRRFDQVTRLLVWLATGVVAVTALALGAWSNQTVAVFLGVSGLAGWGCALVIDGIWLVSLAIVQMYRREPWRALSAYRATLWMVGLSAVTNFAHGLIRFGQTWHGLAAGVFFALLPVALKWLVSVSTRNAMGQLLKAPDAKNRIKQAGQITAEHQLNEVLAPVARLFEAPQVELERITPEPVSPGPKWYHQINLPMTAPEAVEAPPEGVVALTKPVEASGLGTRQARVEDLAKLIAERGGQLNSVTFRDISDRYGVTAKATASNLRKDAHKAYLSNAQTGMYL